MFIWPAIVLERQDAHEDALAKEQVRSCDYFSNVNMPPGPTHFSWSAVFPGDEIRQNTGTGIPYSDEFIIHLPGRSENYLAATVTGCVTYQSAKHYQTRAAYYVMGAHDRFIEIGKKLNPPSIRLLRDQHYEYAK